jgi:organic radical activating enzyme
MIIYNQHDFKWAAELAEKVKPECQLFLQPEWEREDKMLPFIIDYVKKNIQWKISLQTHKYLNIP